MILILFQFVALTIQTLLGSHECCHSLHFGSTSLRGHQSVGKTYTKKTPLTKKDRTYKDSVFLFLFVFRYNPHHKAFFIVFVIFFEIFFKIILRQFQYKPHCCQTCCHQKDQRTDDHNGFFPFFFYCQPQHHPKSANTGFDQCHVFPVAFQHIIIQKCCQLFHNIPAFLYLVTVSYVKSLSCPSKVN